MRVIDGGYLSWAFGTGAYGWNNFAPKLYEQAIIAMDDGASSRAEIFPAYKRRRSEKRMVDPARHQVWQRVQSFKEVLNEDPRLRTLVVPGLEADDLVALYAWARPGIDVVGVDKDLLQCGPYFGRMTTLEGAETTIANINRKLPKTLSSEVQLEAGLEVALYLAIMGDKSDGIPRLVPPRKLDQAVRVFQAASPWQEAYRLYGIPFLRNLLVALLPFPGLFGFAPDETLLETVASGSWNPETLWGWLDDDLRDRIEADVSALSTALTA